MSDQWENQGHGVNSGQQGPYGHQGQGQYPRPDQGQYGQQYQQPQYSQQGQQSQYPQQGQQWGQDPSMYGTPYAYAPPEKRSGVLGAVGLGIVVVATIVLLVLAWMVGQGFGQFMLDVGAANHPIDEQTLASDPRFQEYVRSASSSFIILTFTCLAGLLGWILSIVATVQRRGRGLGIAGIILGVLSLGLAYGALMVGLMPFIEQLGG